jgi:hypothetical protein
MMKSVLLAALVASASAFAPAPQNARSSALAESPFAKEIGAQMPLGFWDPLKTMDGASEETFELWRHIEIKHGRVAMLAVVGYLTTAYGVRFPGAESTPDGFKAFETLASYSEGQWVIFQMFATVLLAEIWNHDKTGKAEFLGDYRNGIHDFGWDKQSDEWKRRKRSIELNNGRAAQMGILGLMTHELLGNSILPSGYLPGQ